VLTKSEAAAIFGNLQTFPAIHAAILQQLREHAAGRPLESGTVGRLFLNNMKRFKTYAVMVSGNRGLLMPSTPRRPLDDFVLVRRVCQSQCKSLIHTLLTDASVLLVATAMDAP